MVLGERTTTPFACSRRRRAARARRASSRATSTRSPSGSARAASRACAWASPSARGLALALDVPVAGVSTLDALAAGAPGAVPLIDAKRREVFTQHDGEVVALPGGGLRGAGTHVRRGRCDPLPRRTSSEPAADVPPDDSELHVPRARFHAQLARDFGAGRAGRADLHPRARRRSDARVKTAVDIRRLTLDDLERDRADRAQGVPDAVVALDVRGRAGQAGVDLPRRVRRASSSPAT